MTESKSKLIDVNQGVKIQTVRLCLPLLVDAGTTELCRQNNFLL